MRIQVLGAPTSIWTSLGKPQAPIALAWNAFKAATLEKSRGLQKRLASLVWKTTDESELPTSLCSAPPGANGVQQLNSSRNQVPHLQTTTHANYSAFMSLCSAPLYLRVTASSLKHSYVTWFSSVWTQMPSPITPAYQDKNLRFLLERNKYTAWDFIF